MSDKDQWISVKDSMPEIGQLVWGYDGYDGYDGCGRVSMYNYQEENTWVWVYSDDLVYHDITHWIPIETPKPPVEGKKLDC